MASPLLGARLTAFGRRRMLYSGLTTLAISTAAFAFVVDVRAPYTYVFMSVFLRMVQGFGAACTQTASYSLTAALFPDRLSLYLGMSETVTGLGFMIGPPLGGWFFMFGGFRAPFVVMGLLPLAVMGVLHRFVPPDARVSTGVGGQGDEGAPGGLRALRLVTRRSGVMVVAGICVAANSAYAFLEPTLEPAFGTRDHVNEGVIGLLFFTVSLTYTATAPAAGLAADARRHGARKVMLCGVTLLALAFLAMGPSPLLGARQPPKALWFLVGSLAAAGVGQSMALVPTMDAMVQNVADLGDDGVNIVSGIINSANSLGEMLGPLLGSLLYQHVGWQWATTVWAAALLALLGAEMAFHAYTNGHLALPTARHKATWGA